VLAPGLVVTLVAAVVPGPWRAPARLGVAAWVAAACATSAREATRGASVADAASLPVVFAAMHVPWGAGFLAGCARFGVPVEALARIVGARR
jgi:hypothetical protein